MSYFRVATFQKVKFELLQRFSSSKDKSSSCAWNRKEAKNKPETFQTGIEAHCNEYQDTDRDWEQFSKFDLCCFWKPLYCKKLESWLQQKPKVIIAHKVEFAHKVENFVVRLIFAASS